MIKFCAGLTLPVSVLILLLVFTGSSAHAETNLASDPIASPSIEVVELEYRLVPLRKNELAAVADHWVQLLQNHLKETSEIKIELTQAGDEEKDSLQETLNQMQEEQINIKDRLNMVLEELSNKGGDVDEYKTYISAVSGVKVDVKDTDTFISAALGWMESSEGGVRWAGNIVLFLVTLFIFFILSGVFGRITERAINRLKGATDLLKHFFVNLVRNLTKVVGFMIALSMLEVDIGPLIAALGAAGFIIGFALQGTLSNFASGLMILIYRPYDVEDVINVADITGKVTSMTLVSTTLTLPDNQIVVIPNNTIWGNTITNITGSETRRVDMIFGIGYDDDISTAENVLADILKNHPLILDDPEYTIKVHELADSSVNFVVRPWAKTADYFTVYWDVTRAVKERFDAEGISIPYPQQDLHLHTVEANAGNQAN